MTPHRTFYNYWRFTRYLAREFRWPIGVFAALILGGGLLLKLTYKDAQITYPIACHAIFMMTFFENTIPFPREWYLQPLWFIIPIVGLGAIADSVVRLGYLVFARKEKLQEWHIMNASAMHNHIVVVGAGKVGYRIIRDLLALKEGIVAVEKNLDGPLVSEVLDMGIPVIHGEGRSRKVLEQAGVARAKAAILVTNDDLANLDAALTAREIKPDLRVVVRLFDETLATKVAGTFKMPAISTSATSAPAFIAAATGRNVFASFSLDGGAETLHVADVCIAPHSPLVGRNIGDIQDAYGVNIIMHKRDGSTQVNPEHNLVLQPQDRMLVIAPIEKIANLERKVE